MTSATAVSSATAMQPVSRSAVVGAGFGLVASFSIGFIFELINARPLPLLFITAGLGICFGVGLALRASYTFDQTLKLPATLAAALIGPLSLTIGTLLSTVAGSALSTSIPQLEQPTLALQTLFQEAFLLLVLGGAAAAAFAASANVPLLFLSAPLALYFIWIIAPTFVTGYIAMTNWDGVDSLDKVRFVGLQNFERLFRDNNFWLAFTNNLRWLAFFILIPTSMGLGMAMIFNNDFPGNRFFKIAFFTPLVIAPAVVGLIWQTMYRPDDGLINSFLRLILGPEAKLPGWLADRDLVLWCIIVAAAWRQVGYVMILYLAGLKSLDVTLVEAATVDGASPWQRFRHVIFPLLGPVTVVVVVISIIDSLRAFDLVAIMTRGQPAYASEVLANFMYMRAFNDYRMGYAGAVAIVLLVLMLFFIIPYLLRVARTELEY